MPVLPGPAPLLLCAASPVPGVVLVPVTAALVEDVAMEESGAGLPVEPGPAPLLLCAASPAAVGGGVEAVLPLSAAARFARPNTAADVIV